MRSRCGPRHGVSAPADSPRIAGSAPSVFARFREHSWIVNSRNTADEQVVHTIASMAGFDPQVMHHVDSLELVQDLIVAGMGVGILPADQPTQPGVGLLALADPQVVLRTYAVTRHGRTRWPALALIVDLLAAQ